MISSIALVIPDLVSGGAERVVACLALALRADFRTCVFVRRGAVLHYDLADVPIIEVEMTAEGMLAAVAEHRIDLILDHYHWDAAHVRMMAGLADQGLKIVLTEHNAFHYPLFQAVRGYVPDQDLWFHDRYEYYRKFCAVTVLNEDTRQSFARHLDNVRRISNPLPYAAATPAATPLAPQGHTVLNVSSFDKPAKRLDLLYRSFAEVQPVVPEARLVIVGDYLWLQDRYFQKASGVAPGRVHCAGRSRRVEPYYRQAAVFALTSEIEGQPMVLLEAAHHGVPQVAFDLPGLRDQVIDGETGHLVPFGDTQAFADRLCALLQDPVRARDMGRAARDFVGKTFALDKIVQDWRDLIHEIDRTGRLATPPAPIPNPALRPAAESSAEDSAEPRAAAKARQDAFWQDHWQSPARKAESGLDPKISFLVPVYGTEDLLGRCLDSIRTQTLTEFECIVVDDGSPGDVEAAFRAVAGDDRRFRLLRHGHNRGLYQARSTAAQAARGLYFAHVDSDDYIHPRFAQIMFAEAVTTGAEIVECQAVEFTPEGWPVRLNQITRESPVDGVEAARAFVNNSIRNMVWNRIYARDRWRRTPDHNQIGGGLSICEDLLRNGLLFPECRRYSSVTDCLYYYCRRATSVVRGGDFRRLVGKLRDIALSYETVKARQSGPDAAWAVRRLEERRLLDVRWYIDEFLDRTDLEQAQAEMQALATEACDTYLSQAIALVERQALERQGRGGNPHPEAQSARSGLPPSP